MNVGKTQGGANVLNTTYQYDTYGNPVVYKSQPAGDNFIINYDDQNRIVYGFDQGFTWEPRGVLDTMYGLDVGYNVITQTHAINTVAGVDRYDYNLNGSMVTRNKGTGWSQALKWDSHNRLAQMTGSGVSESYRYDESGQRIRKTNLLPPGTVTDYPFPGYERTSSGVVRKHYSFNGVAMAVRTGSGSPYLLYQDGVHSTAHVTDLNGNVTAQRGYYAFGPPRPNSTGTMPTDRRFTGQQEDATGIYYFNARYYDAQISQFISPDTIVPDEKNFLSYNRYLYALGNPLKYNDPSGHQSGCMMDAQGNQSCNGNTTIGAKTQTIETPVINIEEAVVIPPSLTPVQVLVKAGVPTVVGIESGVNGSSGLILNGAATGNLQVLFNWYSGELSIFGNYSGGMRVSTPEGGNFGVYIGKVTVTGASRNDAILQGASGTVSADASIDAWMKLGVESSKSIALLYNDANGNSDFELSQGEGVYFVPATDPEFGTPIIADQQGVALSVNVIPNAVDAGVSGTVSDSNLLYTLEVYDQLGFTPPWGQH